MRRCAVVALLCAVLLAPLPAVLNTPVSAQSRTWMFHDPGGRFSIDLPAGWSVATPSAPSLSRAFVGGLLAGDEAGMTRASLAVDGPDSAVGYAVPFLGLVLLDLPGSRPLDDMGAVIAAHVPDAWTKTASGRAKIGGRDAFYEYITGYGMYAVLTFLPAGGRTGFLVLAGTVNDPGRVNTDFATISSVLQSLHATGAP